VPIGRHVTRRRNGRYFYNVVQVDQRHRRIRSQVRVASARVVHRPAAPGQVLEHGGDDCVRVLDRLQGVRRVLVAAEDRERHGGRVLSVPAAIVNGNDRRGDLVVLPQALGAPVADAERHHLGTAPGRVGRRARQMDAFPDSRVVGERTAIARRTVGPFANVQRGLRPAAVGLLRVQFRAYPVLLPFLHQNRLVVTGTELHGQFPEEPAAVPNKRPKHDFHDVHDHLVVPYNGQGKQSRPISILLLLLLSVSTFRCHGKSLRA